MEAVWKQFAPENPFCYFGFDSEFSKFYTLEKIAARLLAIFSVLSIFIAVLGLVGMISYNVATRTKEIAVRKSLGATEQGIASKMALDTIKPMLVSSLLVIPAGWYLMHQWLMGFAYRISINPAWIVIVVLFALSTGILSVIWQVFRAARVSPATSLRNE
jgi:putative ABC transport system permease protein